MTRKGQITIPAEMRRALGIREGDKVAISLPDPEAREMRLHPVRSVAEATFGAVSPRRRPEDFRALRETFIDAVASKEVKDAPPERDE